MKEGRRKEENCENYNHSKQLYSDNISKNGCLNPYLMRRQGKEAHAHSTYTHEKEVDR
jgi:hypothetical protein